MQLFQKRVRHSRPGEKIRIFYCGEYSPTKWRAHYHALLFNYDLPDRKLHSTSKSQFPVYTSEELSSLWPYGHAYTGDVTFASANYVARYQLKKVNGERAADHYYRIHPETGEWVHLRPEFVGMSRRPGIAEGWFRKFASDAFPSDFVTHNGSKIPVPPYYLRKLKAAETDPNLLRRTSFIVNQKRAANGVRTADNNTPERLAIREEVAAERFGRLMRSFEESL